MAAKRKLKLRNLPNEKVFGLYYEGLPLKHKSDKGVYDDHRILEGFREAIGEFPPSADLGVQFMARYARHSSATQYRYYAALKGFSEWYGDPLPRPKQVGIKLPQSLPSYTEDKAIAGLLEGIRGRRTHKTKIERDSLIVLLGSETGLRRAEIANLKVGHLHLDEGIIEVKKGKGGRDDTVFLKDGLAARLAEFVKGKSADDSVFGVAPATISHIVRYFSGAKIHAHQLRHRFATRLVESGWDIATIQRLMRHSDIKNTEKYLSLTRGRFIDAIKSLPDIEGKVTPTPVTDPRRLPPPKPAGHFVQSWALPKYQSKADREKQG